MTIQDIGSIGELIAAIATVATLGYLAVQIRQNSRLQGETAKRATQTAVHDQNLLLFRDGAAFELVSRGMADSSSLDRSELNRFHNFWMSSFINYQEAFYQVKQLDVDEEWWRILEQHMLTYLKSPGLHEWWQRNKETFGTDFVAFVEDKLGSDAAFYEGESVKPSSSGDAGGD